ncbi:toll/interleukin-1 receptor domain-containing protein [Metabacillus bambusae]|uniref:Toll/interleukin-1 receptor domain-containing protein n=1 Tax=Metabacillus bambusae TaxID=2795218 RepID=A0ABS3N0M3_9BACI|nr:toll/interleukin-1 receptor domain-containing protein [Metabacillus bambusae]MBO1511812.1 toll/interleukin-1 receptor domain-containing protein [Metabacillus bambusae]
MDEKIKVFLSHASINFPIMKEMADYLESLGYICWYAPRDIAKGNNYLVDIVDAIDQVDVVLLLHSKEVHDSKYVYREIEYADQMNKLILPILIDDAPIAKQLVLIIRSMQMTSLFEFPSIELAVDVLHERMKTFQIEREQSEISTDWLTSFGAPIVHTHSTKHSTTAFMMKNQRIEQLSRVYVPVPNFQQICSFLTKSHLAVLQHSERTGKYSTAINLLLDQAVEHIIEVLPTHTIVDFMSTQLKHHTGYIIDKASFLFFEKSSFTIWEELQEKLQLVNSFLVITTEETELPDWIVTHSIDCPTNKRSILINHAKERGVNEVPPATLTEIDPFLENLLPYEIVSIPDKLLPVMSGSIDLDAMIKQLQSQVEERVIEWYHQHGHSLRLVSHYLTLAILQEVPENTFTEASQLLQHHLQTSWAQGNEAAFMTDSEQLKILNAERVTKKVNSDIGYIALDHLRLTHPDEAQVILTQFWEQFRFARPAFLQWFDEYVTKARKSEMTALTNALALISSSDLPTIRQELLQKWAMHDNTFYRLTAVKILSKLITSEHYVQEVIHLVNSWSSQRNNLALQWTATVALGSEIGILLYPRSLELLQKAYLSNPKTLRHPAKQSFINLMKLGNLNPDYDEAFLLYFNDWLREEKQMSKEPFEFLHFFFSILRSRISRLIETLTGEQLKDQLSPFISESLLYSKSKRLGEEFLTVAAYEQPKKLAPLVLALLYFENHSVGERAKSWLKIRMTTQNHQPFTELYEEMMQQKGRKTT